MNNNELTQKLLGVLKSPAPPSQSGVGLYIQDPEKAHKLYQDIQKQVRRNLPRRPKPNPLIIKNPKRYNELLKEYRDFKEFREIIYEEVNTFLTGKRKNKDGIRGASGRGAYIHKYDEIMKIIMNWIDEGANPANLYSTLLEKNKSITENQAKEK